MSEWIETTLTDYCDAVKDGTHDSPKKQETGKLLVTSKNIKGSRLDLSTAYNISEDDFNAVNKRSKVNRLDVLLSMIGTVGEVCVIEDDPDFAIKNVGLLKCSKEMQSYWLYYYLLSADAQQKIKERLRGTTQQYLPLGEIRNFPIRYPKDPKVTKSIIDVLKSLDDKIENNRRMNETLEGMAQAIFKSWFVDFDPVHAKVETLKNGGSEDDARIAAMCVISGKSADALAHLKSENPESYAQLATTADAFPSAFVASELGQIPEGWEVGTIGDLAKAKGGYAFKGKDFQENGNPVIKIKNITSDGKVIIEGSQCIDDTIAEKAKRFTLTDGDLIMAMTGATVAKSGIVVSYDLQPFLNQRVAKFESEQFGKDISWYLFCLFRRDDIFSLLVSAAQGSAQPNISSSGIEGVRSIIPSAPLIESFCLKTKSLFIYWIKNEEENQSLAETRDALLPKLLSGEIDVNKVSIDEI